MPSSDEVAARNRYLNVEPWAANRVKLRVADGASDYINASPISLGNRRYIATQGPKDTSTSHFYRMLAAEISSPAVIVMLTQTHEAGREKCFAYFPSTTEAPLQLTADPSEESDGFEGSVTLVSSEEHVECRSTIRKLLLKTKTNESDWHEMDVYHCLFGGWPDFSIPEGENRDAMLKLISLSCQLNSAPSPPSTSCFAQLDQATDTEAKAQSVDLPPPSYNPRIVHCSAGVGRSGTFIALDYLFAQLQHGGLDDVPDHEDPIVKAVDKMRQQRMMMVQSEAQFIFLYEVLRSALLDRWSTLQADGAAGA